MSGTFVAGGGGGVHVHPVHPLHTRLNGERNIFLLNYRNICHKINKPIYLDIQVNSELQS